MSAQTNQSPLVRIVDDDVAVCESLVFMLRHEGYDVESWTSAEEYLREDNSCRSGCLLLDIRMPSMSGLELQKILCQRSIRLPIIFISAHGDIDTAVHTMKMGAVDFLQKPLDPERVLRIVAHAVARSDIQNKLAVEPEVAKQRFEKLTDREKTVADLVYNGLSNLEVGKRLNISERTAETHRANIYRKLEISDIDGLRAVMLSQSFFSSF